MQMINYNRLLCLRGTRFRTQKCGVFLLSKPKGNFTAYYAIQNCKVTLAL